MQLNFPIILQEYQQQIKICWYYKLFIFNVSQSNDSKYIF
jgi:hypothetical protein